MNIILRKNHTPYYWFLSDWTARTVGGPETLETIWWSRKTHGLDWSDWSGWPFRFGWSEWKDIEDELSETHPGVLKPSEVIL